MFLSFKSVLRRIPAIFFILILGLALSACLGSGSSSDSTGPGGGTGDGSDGGDGDDGGDGGDGGGDGGGHPDAITSLDELSGLESDAGVLDRLFFLSRVEGNSGLFAVHPQYPSDPPQLVEPDIWTQGLPLDMLLLPLHRASWDPEEGMVQDFRIDRVLMPVKDDDGMPTILKRVSTDPEAPTADPVEVTSGIGFYVPSQIRALHHLAEPDQTLVAFQSSDGWKQFAAGDDETTDYIQYEDRFADFIPVSDMQTTLASGWIALDRDADELHLLNHDGHSDGVVAFPADMELDDVATLDGFAHQLLDSSLYVTIGMISENEDGQNQIRHELWHYQPAESGPGRIDPVRNADDEILKMTSGFAMRPLLPGGHQMVVDGNRLFMARQEGLLFGQSHLLRIEGNQWDFHVEPSDEFDESPFLIRSGDSLIWAETQERILKVSLDGNQVGTLDIHTLGNGFRSPVTGASNGWVFYNASSGDSGTAIAREIGGEGHIRLDDAIWVGSTTSGSVGLGTVSDASEPSEVFLLEGNQTVSAVSAASPLMGKVVLGDLPGNANAVNIFGVAPGPQRLAQSYNSDDNSGYEVILLDTRESGSLTVISSQAEDDPIQRPVNGF